MVAVNIEKKEIHEGIRRGIFTKRHRHKNPYPEIDEPGDRSYEEHSLMLYINQSYNVAGVRSFFGESPPLDGNIRIPIVLNDKIEMKINLHMLTQDDFNILKVCDGFNSIEQVAEITQLSLEKIEQIIDDLHKQRLVDIIRTR